MYSWLVKQDCETLTPDACVLTPNFESIGLMTPMTSFSSEKDVMSALQRGRRGIYVLYDILPPMNTKVTVTPPRDSEGDRLKQARLRTW